MNSTVGRLFVSLLTIFLTIVTFSASAHAEALGLHGPQRVGVVPGKPFVYLVGATGQGQLLIQATGLPQGLSLDNRTGVIRGQVSATLNNVDVTFSVRDSSGRTVFRKYQFVVHPGALAVTPPMGWNSWYVYGCNISDQRIRQAADRLISTGLAARGYNYVLIDDCWQDRRGADGEMIPKASFPDMKALGDYIHSKGLRFGIYTSPGDKTCGQHPGSKGHLAQDVATYARWGVDFVKYDWCMFENEGPAKVAMVNSEPAEYLRMSQLLKASPRAIVHQICQYGEGAVWRWGAQAGGQLWRTHNDVADVWPVILRNGFSNMGVTPFQRPGHYNDLDMLMVGKSNWPSRLGQYEIPQTAARPTQLTQTEQYTHITLWSLMASPLIISSDLNQIDPFTKSLLTNDDILAVNQDPLVAPARLVNPSTRILTPVIMRRMVDGSIVVGLFNNRNVAQYTAVNYSELGLTPGPKKIRDLWQGTEQVVNINRLGWNVAPHGVAFFKISNP